MERMIRTAIIAANGSIRQIEDIPDDVDEYLNGVGDVHADTHRHVGCSGSVCRPVAVTQSSLLSDQITQNSPHAFLCVEKGTEDTGMYYLRTKAAAEAVKVTLPVRNSTLSDECLSCSS